MAASHVAGGVPGGLLAPLAAAQDPESSPLGWVLEAISEAFFAFDGEGRLVYMNRCAEEIFYTNRADAVGRHARELLPEELRGTVREQARRAVASAAPVVFETESALRPGHRMEVRLHAVGGGFVALVRDTTTRHLAEAARHEAEGLREEAESARRQSEEGRRRAEGILESISDGFLLIDAPDWRLTYVNTRGAELLDRKRHELLGHPFFEVFPEFVDSPFDKAFRAALERGKKQVFEAHSSVTKRWFEVHAYPAESGLSVYFHDVTDRKRAERALRESEQRYRSLFDGVPIGLYRTLPDGRLIDANPALVKLLGYEDRAELLSADANTLYVDAAQREEWRVRLEWEGVVNNFEVQFRRADGSRIWVRSDARAVRDQQGRLLFYEGALEDISAQRAAQEELARQAEELRELSLVDELTGLYNRRGFHTLAQQQLKTADRVERSLCLVFFDLDDFKLVNDQFGHAEGDRALREIARMLRETFRESDIVGRLGGDEFVALALEADEEGGQVLVERLNERLAEWSGGARGYEVSMSAGVAAYDSGSRRTLEELLEEADRRMYRDKGRR